MGLYQILTLTLLVPPGAAHRRGMLTSESSVSVGLKQLRSELLRSNGLLAADSPGSCTTTTISGPKCIHDLGTSLAGRYCMRQVVSGNTTTHCCQTVDVSAN